MLVHVAGHSNVTTISTWLSMSYGDVPIVMYSVCGQRYRTIIIVLSQSCVGSEGRFHPFTLSLEVRTLCNKLN